MVVCAECASLSWPHRCSLQQPAPARPRSMHTMVHEQAWATVIRPLLRCTSTRCELSRLGSLQSLPAWQRGCLVRMRFQVCSCISSHAPQADGGCELCHSGPAHDAASSQTFPRGQRIQAACTHASEPDACGCWRPARLRRLSPHKPEVSSFGTCGATDRSRTCMRRSPTNDPLVQPGLMESCRT